MKSLRWIISRPDVCVHARLAWFISQSPAMKQTVLQDRLANYANANKLQVSWQGTLGWNSQTDGLQLRWMCAAELTRRTWFELLQPNWQSAVELNLKIAAALMNCSRADNLQPSWQIAAADTAAGPTDGRQGWQITAKLTRLAKLLLLSAQLW